MACAETFLPLVLVCVCGDVCYKYTIVKKKLLIVNL